MTAPQLDRACILAEDFVRACLRFNATYGYCCAPVEVDADGVVRIEDRERFTQLVAGLTDDLRREEVLA